MSLSNSSPSPSSIANLPSRLPILSQWQVTLVGRRPLAEYNRGSTGPDSETMWQRCARDVSNGSQSEETSSANDPTSRHGPALPAHCHGPLPRSKAGHKYILTICDYSSRYPEAIPFKSTDSKHVAEALLPFFSHVGIPQEILTDCGTNFTSRLMEELYGSMRSRRAHTIHKQMDLLNVLMPQ